MFRWLWVQEANSLSLLFPSEELDSGHTFIWSRQVGTAMRLMLSEEVLMSTLQSRSSRRGRETGGDSFGQGLYNLSLLSFDSMTGGCRSVATCP